MSTLPLRVREATADDEPAMAALDSELFGVDAWSPAAIASDVEACGRRVVVSGSPQVLDGYAVSMVAGDVVDLLRIGVRPQARRHGIATALLDDLLEHAQGAERMLLEVSAVNESAIALYRRHGFATIATRTRYYRDGSDAVVMARDLAVTPPERMQS